MIKRRLGFAGVLLAGMILILYLVGGGKLFGRSNLSKCERLWKESDIVFVEGEVYKKVRKEEKLILYLKRIGLRDEKKAVAGERLLVYLDLGEINPEIGKRIFVKGKAGFFEKAANPGNFDQKNYYLQQNIRMMLWDGKILEEQTGRTSLREKLWRFRNEITDRICLKMGKRYGGILSAMLLGESLYTEEEVKEIYRAAGIGHLLAISGLHISFFGAGIFGFMRRKGVPILGAAAVGSFFLCIYVGMTGMSVSAVRAFVMFLIRMGAEISGREYDGMVSLAVAEILVLVGNPLLLFSSSFQFSFGAVLGIYLIGQESRKGKISSAIVMSLGLQLFLLPITLWNYYETCLYSCVWNALVIPLATLVMIFGSVGIIGGWMPGIAGDLIQSALWKITEWILIFYEKGSTFLLGLPGARWTPGRPKIWQIVGYYGFFLFLLWKRKKQSDQKKQIWYRKGKQFLAGAVLLFLIGMPKWKRGQMELTMLDVGQGDCFFLRDGTGKNYLIDGGSSSVDSVGKYRIESFLKSQGINRLDYVWVTHGDADHLNGITELLRRKKCGVKIDTLVLPEQRYWDEKLSTLWEEAETAKTTVCVMEQDMVYRSGKMKVRCLWPGAEKKAEDANENSLVLHVTYGDFTMLFTGDLEKEAEEMVAQKIKSLQEKGELPQEYDLLKVGHHGSKNATTEELLEVMKPRVAFCSAGKENHYGHPHAETLERLAKWGVSLYNTKDRGAVSLHTDGRKYGIQSP